MRAQESARRCLVVALLGATAFSACGGGGGTDRVAATSKPRAVTPPGEKPEGDGRSPTGAFAFDFAFGVLDDPGVKLPYRRITGGAIVWDDDPASPRYNLWTDTARETAGADAEPMYNQPAYNYGAVIAYNVERTPGLGSAIFLHVAKDGPTAGCIAVPQDRLLELLRWLDPARQPRIVMGARADVTG